MKVNIKLDSTKVLSIAATALGLVSTLLSSKVHSNEMENMKAELKDEIIKDLQNK